MKLFAVEVIQCFLYFLVYSESFPASSSAFSSVWHQWNFNEKTRHYSIFLSRYLLLGLRRCAARLRTGEQRNAGSLPAKCARLVGTLDRVGCFPPVLHAPWAPTPTPLVCAAKCPSVFASANRYWDELEIFESLWACLKCGGGEWLRKHYYTMYQKICTVLCVLK